MIKVFQIQDQKSIFPKVSFTYGMGEGFGMTNTDVLNYFRNGLYVEVAEIDTVIPEVAFKVGNTGYGADMYKTPGQRMRSVSVGDVLMLEGDLLVVADEGFVNLGRPLEEVA